MDEVVESVDSCSQELRRATAEQHERAERSPFVEWLLDGRLPLAGFAALAAQHYRIYGALESAAERWRHDPVAGPFVIDGLERQPSLGADLELMIGPNWADEVPTLPATAAYCDRISVQDTAAGFVAHHYTRYLGDVSGGQVVASKMRRQHRDSAGVSFYDFAALYAGPLKNPAEFRRHYRQLLDDAAWDRPARMILIDEAQVAFEHNRAVFAELADWCSPKAA